MRMTDERRREAVEKARKAYGQGYCRLRFPGAVEAEAATRKRAALLVRISDRAELATLPARLCLGTKVASGALSPGCEICVAGTWSCLFINERCNKCCFYCPAPQERTGVPMTNSVPFPKAAEYAEYLAAFGFRGASISGGEPLLTAERTLSYIRTVKRRFGGGMHIWLYNNGTLLSADLVARLRDAGLDEIRFNIYATRYRLDRVRLAAGAIECVTVEIPAIPEDLEMLKGKLAEIEDAGVRFLNLHQLRLTPYNFPKLVERPYTFLHGDQVTVLESELAALGLIEYALDAGIELPINYCSSVYKNRFQRAAARRRSAAAVKRGNEEVTRAGFIRAMRDRPEQMGLSLAYHEPCILPTVTYRNTFVEIPLGRGRKIAVERSPACPELVLSQREAAEFSRAVLAGEAPVEDACGESLRRALEFELIEPGLHEYF
jgi:pyruvate formate-lyase activating enzyme-like uncharacterized protein